MFAETSPSVAFPASGWFRLPRLNLPKGFLRRHSRALPPEIRRLSPHLLRDLGIDPNVSGRPDFHLVTPPDLLQSPRALAEFLAVTTR
ncbi:MAG: hypothetical protein KDJ87_04835 [Rhizobiaceae bacterium]|nr:hypothetical protein [Rhizobiaceae bacterium]